MYYLRNLTYIAQYSLHGIGCIKIVVMLLFDTDKALYMKLFPKTMKN